MKAKTAASPGACHVADRRDARAAVPAAAQGRRVQLGGPARPRKRAHRRRAHGARHRARLRAGQAVPARASGQPRGALRSRHYFADGRARPARPDHPGRIRRRRPRLRRLWADHARDRARRFRLPLRHVGAVLARHASDLRLWQRGAAQEISAEARDRRADRLLRPHRARPRLRPRLDGDARGEGAGRLPAHRQQDVDHQFAGRRCRGGVGEARRRHSRIPGGARHQGFLDPEDRRQAVAAHLDHRRGRARGCASFPRTTCCRT